MMQDILGVLLGVGQGRENQTLLVKSVEDRVFDKQGAVFFPKGRYRKALCVDWCKP